MNRTRKTVTMQTSEPSKEKKLMLRKQTLRNLTPAKLEHVHGGAPNDTGGSGLKCATDPTNGVG